MSGPINGEYRCQKCGSRVYPYSGLELATEAPERGVLGEPVLLSSFNTRQRARGGTWVYAWCRLCNRMGEAEHVSGDQLLLEFCARRGVTVRIPGNSPERQAQWLATRLEQRRNAVQVVTTPRTRRRTRRAS